MNFTKVLNIIHRQVSLPPLDGARERIVFEGQVYVWDKDLFEFDWECLSGCPPGFDCSSKRIEICQSGASFNGGCATCPPGFICQPGKYPRPCPLGQYLSVTSKHGQTITWGSQEQDSRKISSMKTLSD